MVANIEELRTLFRGLLADLGDERISSFLPAFDAAAEPRGLKPNALSCLRHLSRAAMLAPPAARPLCRWFDDNRNALRWGQTYTAADFGQDFIDGYGWVELVGTRGHFASTELAAGFILLGPGIDYPDHHHVAEEVYVPLTGGTLWRKGEGAYTERGALEAIHHPSNVNHAMRTRTEPLFALYLWRGGPLAQKSVIGTGD